MFGRFPLVFALVASCAFGWTSSASATIRIAIDEVGSFSFAAGSISSIHDSSSAANTYFITDSDIPTGDLAFASVDVISNSPGTPASGDLFQITSTIRRADIAGENFYLITVVSDDYTLPFGPELNLANIIDPLNITLNGVSSASIRAFWDEDGDLLAPAAASQYTTPITFGMLLPASFTTTTTFTRSAAEYEIGIQILVALDGRGASVTAESLAQVTPTPEPGSLIVWTTVLGCFGLVAWKRRRSHQA